MKQNGVAFTRAGGQTVVHARAERVFGVLVALRLRGGHGGKDLSPPSSTSDK
jgi:hypothetical protein